jgi:predicted dehydrogenase
LSGSSAGAAGGITARVFSGDLLTHEYDAINQIMGVGIPHSAVSSGGVYFFKDGRTVPDVLHTVFEFPEKNLTVLYSATLASQLGRGKKVMGHDAYMEMGNTLTIYPDPSSTRYAENIERGIIKPDMPIYSYIPGRGVDAVTSATERYFADRGLLYAYRGGRRVNTTHLHLKEWIDSIRKGTQPSCDIDQGFEEAMAAHMGTLAYHHKKQIFWDKENEQIIV